MSKWTSKLGLILAGLIALASIATPARAALIGNFSGNTQPSQPAPGGGGVGALGFIDFEVFNTSGGVAGDTYGTGNANFDTALTAAGIGTSGSFLYLFQVANESTSTITQTQAGVATAPGVLGSGIVANTLTFSIAGGLGGTLNGVPFTGPSAAAPGNPSGVSVFPVVPPAGPYIVAGAPTNTPTSITVSPGNILTLTYSLAPGQTSRIFGYNTNNGPSSFGPGSFQGPAAIGTISANGLVPIGSPAIPEPGSLALAAIGGLAVAAGAWRRRSAKV